MTKEKVSWFVEPLNGHTNEVIARNLLALSQCDENMALLDLSGNKHSVYSVENYFFVSRLYKDRKKFSLKFKVYTKRGKHGKLVLWTFDEIELAAKARR